MQSAINAELARHLGSALQSALISFAVGLLVLFMLCVALIYIRAPLVGGLPSLKALSTISPWWLCGGILGAVIVALNVIFVPRLGVAVVLLLVVFGQIFFSLIMDHYALLNLPKQALTWQRLLGVILMIAGIVLFSWKSLLK